MHAFSSVVFFLHTIDWQNTSAFPLLGESQVIIFKKFQSEFTIVKISKKTSVGFTFLSAFYNQRATNNKQLNLPNMTTQLNNPGQESKGSFFSIFSKFFGKSNAVPSVKDVNEDASEQRLLRHERSKTQHSINYNNPWIF
jgi:hypothetical protein